MHQKTEIAMMSTDLGCLPSLYEAKKWHDETGKVWVCHDNPKRPCEGLVKLGGIDPTGKPLITEGMTLEEIYA